MFPKTTIQKRPRTRRLSDNELMALIDSGDVEANLATLEQRYGAAILNYVGGIVRDQHLAEDVAQEVFAKVFFKSHLYRPDSNFRAWLFEIARNQALTALRTRRHTPTPIGSLELSRHEWGEDGGILENVPDGRIDRQLEEQEFMTAFAAAVGALPKRYSEAFELCVLRGVPYQEAAQTLGIPSGTVAIRIMRARKRLYAQLAHHMDRLRRPPACLQSGLLPLNPPVAVRPVARDRVLPENPARFECLRAADARARVASGQTES